MHPEDGEWCCVYWQVRDNAWNPEVGTGAMSLKLGLGKLLYSVYRFPVGRVTTDKQTHQIRYYTAGVHLDSDHHC